jgi:flagellar hook assembly protein FlgD
VQTGYPIDLTGVYNYPNPFRDNTFFTFDHNKPGEELDVRIDIYNLAGQYITTLEASIISEQTTSIPIYWDGTTEEGALVSPGLYIYTLTVKSGGSFTSQQSSKLLIVR